MPTFTLAQIEHFKDQAKRLSRTRQILHSQALDEIAASHGFRNWQLLMRGVDPQPAAVPVLSASPFFFARDEDEWRAALRTIRDADARRPATFPGLRNICRSFTSPAEAVRFAEAYMQALLALPRYQVGPDSPAYAEMRWWLPYCVHVVDDEQAVRLILNRHYKPVGHTDTGFVEYPDFPHLHLGVGLQALRTFSTGQEGSGHLYKDSTAPWISRRTAKAYLDNLASLRAACTGQSDEAPWLRDHEDLYLALRPWAGVPTWFTPHPADERRLTEVLERLKRWSNPPTESQLRVVLGQFREDNPVLLGGQASERDVDRFAQRIVEALRRS